MVEEAPVTMEQAENKGEKQPVIRRGRVDSLTLYEITDYELDVLTTGSPGSIFLNFAIFCFSIAISFLIALLTTTINSSRVFTVFVILVVVGFLAGIILLVLWFVNHKSVSNIVKRIKQRVPPELSDQDKIGKENQP
jgi:hypothetical protein